MDIEIRLEVFKKNCLFGKNSNSHSSKCPIFSRMSNKTLLTYHVCAWRQDPVEPDRPHFLSLTLEITCLWKYTITFTIWPAYQEKNTIKILLTVIFFVNNYFDGLLDSDLW